MYTINYDVIVVGGGLAGCSAAYYLAKGGMNVCLIEMRSICSGASGRMGGQVHQVEGRYELSTKDKIYKRNSIAKNGKILLDSLNEELSYDIQFVKTGSLDLAFNQQEVEDIKKVIKLQNEAGDTDLYFLDASETQDLCPIFSDNIQGAKLRKDDGNVSPFRITHGFIHSALKKGLQVRTYTNVKSLIFKKSKVTGVVTDKGNFTAKYGVVNATNAWSSYIIPDYPIMPVKLMGFATEQLPVIPICALEMYHDGEEYYTGSQTTGNIIFGGPPVDFPFNKDDHLNEVVYLTDFIRFGKVFKKYFNRIKDVHFIRSWAGALANTPDSFPLVGPTKYENFYMLAGFTNGNTWCPICGKMIAEYIFNNGKTSIPIDFMDPERFSNQTFEWPEKYNYTVLNNYIASKAVN